MVDGLGLNNEQINNKITKESNKMKVYGKRQNAHVAEWS